MRVKEVVVLVLALMTTIVLASCTPGTGPGSSLPSPNGGQIIGQPGQSHPSPPPGKSQGGGYSAKFIETVRLQIALGLRLTVDQLTSDITGGKSITDVAAAQGVSSGLLHTIELGAYQSGFDQAVEDGTYTQAQAKSYMANYQSRKASTLNYNVTLLFGGV